jgi:hypothetical protein
LRTGRIRESTDKVDRYGGHPPCREIGRGARPTRSPACIMTRATRMDRSIVAHLTFRRRRRLATDHDAPSRRSRRYRPQRAGFGVTSLRNRPEAPFGRLRAAVVSPPSPRARSGRNRTRGSEWQTRFQPEATFHPVPISARTAAIRLRWDRRGISRPARSAATASGTPSLAETAFMTRIPTATPRDAPSVDCLGMGRGQGLVHLATSASGRNATLKRAPVSGCRRPAGRRPEWGSSRSTSS